MTTNQLEKQNPYNYKYCIDESDQKIKQIKRD